MMRWKLVVFDYGYDTNQFEMIVNEKDEIKGMYLHVSTPYDMGNINIHVY